MKLCFMKQDALEMIKGNLTNWYTKYYTDNSNNWLYDLYGDDPFVEFKDIPDFQLADLSELSAGEAELENCKIIYQNLAFITESQACDERLWAGLCNSVFYNYVRQRWSYDNQKKLQASQKSIGEIKSRFLFAGGMRSGYYRNTLAKCWWVGRNTFDKTRANQFEKLDIIGSNDINSKITELFYNDAFCSNPYILNAIIEGMRYFIDEKIAISVRNHIRPTMQLINAIGGNRILDCMDAEEITDIFVNNVLSIIQGDNQEISISETDEISDENDTTEIVDEGVILENNGESSEDKGNAENRNSDIYVTIGCRVDAIKKSTNSKSTFLVEKVNGQIPKLVGLMLGKYIGNTIDFLGDSYTIRDIYLG